MYKIKADGTNPVEIRRAFQRTSAALSDLESGKTGYGAAFPDATDYPVGYQFHRTDLDTTYLLNPNKQWVDQSNAGVGFGDLIPTGSYDLGDASNEWQNLYVVDLWCSGDLDVGGDTTLGGTLGVTGAATFDSTLDVTGAMSASNFVSDATNNNLYIGTGFSASDSDATKNIIIGHNAGASLTTADFNVLIGAQAGEDLTTGGVNVFIGAYAGRDATGGYNIGLGANTIREASSNNSVAIGYDAGRSITSGGNNFCLGAYSGNSITSGGNCVAIGVSALRLYNTYNCICIGFQAGYNNSTANRLMIDVSNTDSPLLDGDFSGRSLTINDDLYSAGPFTPGAYTVATAPTASSYTGGMIYVSDGDSGSPCLAVSNGTNWLRIALGSTISAT